jgi:ABC-type sugar transport system ATPase subunit
MARLRFEVVTRHFAGAREPAVADVDLDVADGAVVTVTGASGSGKTTLLRLAAGLEVPDRGRVLIGESGLDDPQVALVFQNYAVYPNLSVRENIALPLKRLGRKDKEISVTVDEVIGLMGLGDLTKRSASALTTSERMRVALARSVVRRPDVLLMDEPLANLERGVRDELAEQLSTAHQAFGTTTLYAASSADPVPTAPGRLVLLEGGRLQGDVPATV